MDPLAENEIAMSRTIAILLLAAGCAAAQPAAVEARVEALLKQMTLEEKIGQMTQVTIDVVSAGGAGWGHPIDPAKLATAGQKYHVGSILNVNGEAYTLEHWHAILNAIQDEAAKTRLKIPVLYGVDSIHGANYTHGAALLPQAIAMAATWNPALARRAGEISAHQTRASGIPWNFYPVLDIGRNPVWPRFWETFGEDVLLATRLGVAYIEGMQGKDPAAPFKVAACLKHYAGYSLPMNGKDRTPAWISERMMRQYVLPMFEAAHLDMIWVGVIVVKYIEIGLLTPPIGLNAYVVKGVVGDAVPLTTIFRGLAWFIAAEAVVMVLLIAFPEISTWLPARMAG